MTIIAFIGSVFSPYYAWSGRRDPANHVALNVALYGPRGRWTMTERGRGSAERERDSFRIGPSSLSWDENGLTVRIDEIAVPHLGRVRGTVLLRPSVRSGFSAWLDAAGRHAWRPFAPRAQVEVEFERPALRWRGAGYADSNFGVRPLEHDFRRWTWARAAHGDGAATLYDVERRDGSAAGLALRFSADGGVVEMRPPPEGELPRTLWRLARTARSDADAPPRAIAEFEDAPFYSRAHVAARLWGVECACVHETLDLDRFSSPWCRALLPFRMPRRP